MSNLSKENLKFFIIAYSKNIMSYGAHYLFFIYLGSLALFGKFFTLYLFLKLIQVVSLFGTNRLLLSHLPQAILNTDKKEATLLINFSYLMMCIATIMGGTLAIFFLQKITHLDIASWIMVIVNLLIINFLFISRTILRVFKKKIIANIFFEFIIDLLTMYIPFFLITHHSSQFFYSFLILSLILCLCLSFYSFRVIQYQNQIVVFKNHFDEFNLDYFKESFWFMLQALQKLFFYYINFFILSLSHGYASTGLYSSAWVVFRITNITNKASSQACTVSVAERKNHPKLMSFFIKENLIFRMSVVSIIFIILDYLFFLKLPNQDFLSLSVIFYFALLLNCFNSLSTNILNNTGRVKTSLKNLLIKNSSKLILSQIFVIYWGCFGAAYAFLLSQIIVFFSNLSALYPQTFNRPLA